MVMYENGKQEITLHKSRKLEQTSTSKTKDRIAWTNYGVMSTQLETTKFHRFPTVDAFELAVLSDTVLTVEG